MYLVTKWKYTSSYQVLQHHVGLSHGLRNPAQVELGLDLDVLGVAEELPLAHQEVVDVELPPVALAAEPGGVPRAVVERVLRLDPPGAGAAVETVDELWWKKY